MNQKTFLRPSPLALLSLVAIAATFVVAVMLTRAVPELRVRSFSVNPTAEPLVRGVDARVTAGSVFVERSLPALAFFLEPGQSLDPRLPPGPFEAIFTVTFSPGSVGAARIGAEIRGGSLLINMKGREIATDHAGQEPRLVLSREPIVMGASLRQAVFEFRADGSGPTGLRAMWQPEGSLVPLPMPTGGARLVDDPAVAGLVLAQQMNCSACHRSEDPALMALLSAAPAPLLGQIGARARPAWIHGWLTDPQSARAGAAMPQLFLPSANAERQIADLTAFLASMGGPLSDPVETPPEGLVATGKLLFQEVGCVACHGPREMDAEPTLFEYVPLGPLAAKTTLAALADYLEDPLQIWPSGQMPSMLLTEPESQAIAAYLIASDLAERAADSTPTRAEVTPDAQAVARGRSLFAEVGCANCHRLGPDRSPIDPALVAAPMERLNGTAPGGCLGSSPAAGVPRFALNDAQRRSLLAFLRQLPERRSADVPHELVASAMTRLRCTACHVYHPEAGPEPAVATYFRTIGEADLGDEGRLPPNLTGVGARLNPRWLTQVLEERARVRPYLSARMPEYGSAVALLGSALTAVAGVDHQPDEGPPFQLEAARVGRELVGATAMNCIQCHTISGRDSTGTPGPDLAKTVERLRFDHFSLWLHDPSLIRPGTRMPSFFIAGRSAFTQFFGGRAEDQIRAIWSYLSQGELLPLPEGLIDPGGLILEVTDEPVVFRTFMEAAGVRAIACGFPEQVHCAFDADACRVTLVWTGPFLSAQGAWAARGGSETNPEQPRWKAHDAPLFRPIQRDAPFEPAFEGYRLDGEGRPVFRYRLRGGPTELFVTERPLPKREQQHASLVSRLTVSGAPGDRVLVDAGDLPFRLIRGEAAAQDDGLVLLTLDPQGESSFDLEVTW